MDKILSVKGKTEKHLEDYREYFNDLEVERFNLKIQKNRISSTLRGKINSTTLRTPFIKRYHK